MKMVQITDEENDELIGKQSQNQWGSAERSFAQNPGDCADQFPGGEMVQEAVPARGEFEVLELLVKSLNNPGISARLYSSIGTTRTHVCNIIAKLGVSNRAEAITLAQ